MIRDKEESTYLGEEGVEGVVAVCVKAIGGHLTVRLDTVLQAVELPASITNLDTGLSDVDRDTFAHSSSCVLRRWKREESFVR